MDTSKTTLATIDDVGPKRSVEANSQTLRRDGFAHFNAQQLLNPTDTQHLGTLFKGALDKLPPDRHCPAGNRSRRLSWFWVLPQSGHIEVKQPKWDPDLREFVTEFFQDADANLTDGGVIRKFAPLTADLCEDGALQRLILADLSLLHWWSDRDELLLVGVHFMMHVARPGAPAVSPPDHFHRDEQPFTAIHLLERQHVTGGINYIAPAYYANRKPREIPPEDILAQLTLTQFLDTLMIKDVQVSHYVDPIHVVPGQDRGWRAVLLIDFTPCKPRLV